MSDPIPLPERLSYSSLSTYAECGEKWRLTRCYGLEEHTWWATVGGSTVHDLIERHLRVALGETDDLPEGWEQDTFESVFDMYAQEELAKGLEIRASGRQLNTLAFAGGPDKKDRQWWLTYGPAMLAAFVGWHDDALRLGWELLATEQQFEVSIGGETVRGVIDLVYLDDQGEVVILDVKSGAETPGKLQLLTYRDGLRLATGLEAVWGAYLRFDAYREPGTRAEGDVYAHLAGNVHYDTFPQDYVSHQYDMARRGIEGGIFLPNTRNNCRACGVRDYCRAVDGRNAGLIPVVSTFAVPTL